MFAIELTTEAIDDLAVLRRFDQQKIIGAIEGQLPHQATGESRNRKWLRPNQLAEWELRVDEFRIFYDVDVKSAIVKVVAIGQKRGSKLYIHGKEYRL